MCIWYITERGLIDDKMLYSYHLCSLFSACMPSLCFSLCLSPSPSKYSNTYTNTHIQTHDISPTQVSAEATITKDKAPTISGDTKYYFDMNLYIYWSFSELYGFLSSSVYKAHSSSLPLTCLWEKFYDFALIKRKIIFVVYFVFYQQSILFISLFNHCFNYHM